MAGRRRVYVSEVENGLPPFGELGIVSRKVADRSLYRLYQRDAQGK